MRYMILSLLLVFATASCDGDGGGSINPTSGTWAFVGGEIFDDGCGWTDPPTDPNGNFTLTNHGDGTLTIDPGGGDPTFECTLTGSNFSCPSRLEDEITQNGIDAVVSVHVSAQGSFSSNTAATGHETADISCTGTACDTVATFLGITLPCSYSHRFTADHSG